jgi:benzoate 4-monooxygenase
MLILALVPPFGLVSWPSPGQLHRSLVPRIIDPKLVFLLIWFRRFFTFLGGSHHLVEQSLHERFGNIVRTGPTTLSFATLPAFEAIYSYNKGIEKGDHYSSMRPDNKSTSVFNELFSVNNRPRRRILIDAALSSNHVAGYNPIIVKHATKLQLRVAKQLSHGNTSINVAPLVHRYTFDTMIELAFGPSISPSPYTTLPAAQHVLEDYRVAGKMSWATGMLPWLRWFMGPIMRGLTRRLKYDTHGNLIDLGALATSTRHLVFEQPQIVKSTTQQPSIVRNLMLSAGDRNETTHLYSDPEQVWGESFNMTFAGPGSTAAAITAVLYQLGTKPGKQWQERIRLEMTDDKNASSYSLSLRAVVKETLRLHAPFPSAFPRIIMPGGESTIPGIVTALPIGTTVYANTWVLGRSKEIWGPDAEEWNPARWIVAGASGKDKSPQLQR